MVVVWIDILSKGRNLVSFYSKLVGGIKPLMLCLNVHVPEYPKFCVLYMDIYVEGCQCYPCTSPTGLKLCGIAFSAGQF